jgi:hypothetical protein
LTKPSKTDIEEKTAFSINDAGKTDYLHAEE